MLIGLYGAGTLGRRIGRALGRQFVFVDDTPAKSATVIDGHEVVPLVEFARRADGIDARLYVCIYQPGFAFERKRQQVAAAHPALECRPFTQLLLNEAASALPFLFFELADVLAAKLGRSGALRPLLADVASRAALDGHLRLRQSGCFDEIVRTARRDVPFLLDRLAANVEYIDAGAFDGGTAEDFIEMTQGRFQRICLVEPDLNNARRAASRMAALGMGERVAIRQQAVAGERGWRASMPAQRWGRPWIRPPSTKWQRWSCPISTVTTRFISSSISKARRWPPFARAWTSSPNGEFSLLSAFTTRLTTCSMSHR